MTASPFSAEFVIFSDLLYRQKSVICTRGAGVSEANKFHIPIKTVNPFKYASPDGQALKAEI